MVYFSDNEVPVKKHSLKENFKQVKNKTFLVKREAAK